MLTTLILMTALMDAAPKAPVVCHPTAPRGPSLVLTDAQGKCPKDTKAEGETKGKAQYCVNTKQWKPMTCETGKLPPGPAPVPAAAKKK